MAKNPTQFLSKVLWCLAVKDKKRAAKLLWPWMVQNEWTDRIWDALDKNQFLCIMGHGSASKSFTAAAWFLLDWWTDPENTACIITSDTVASMSRRIWSDVKILCQKTRIQMPGTLIDSRRIIKHAAHDEKNAIAAIAAESDDAQSKIQGIHTKKIRVIIDEADNRISGSIWAAISNLSTSGNLKVVALANPADRSGHFGRHCEPVAGWSSVSCETDHEWDGKLGWHVLRLDGFRSPNILAGKDNFPFLLTNVGLNSIREKDGENSPQWWSYVRAWFPPEGALNTIFTQEILKNIKSEPHKWYISKVPIAACDPAFEGGDACVLTLGYMGRLASDPKKTAISVTQFIRIKRKNTSQPITIDFAHQIVDICKKHGVKPENFTIDSTGNALGLSDYIKHIWKPDTLAVCFGGKPTDLKITQEDSRKASDRYDRFVSELWYSTREWMKLGLIHVENSPQELLFQLESRLYKLMPVSQKISIEKKLDMKERGLDSPDFGDSFCLLIHLVRTRCDGYMPTYFPNAPGTKKHDPLKRFRKHQSVFELSYGVEQPKE